MVVHITNNPIERLMATASIPSFMTAKLESLEIYIGLIKSNKTKKGGFNLLLPKF